MVFRQCIIRQIECPDFLISHSTSLFEMRSKRAFTLAELMIAISIFTVLSLGVSIFLIDTNRVILSSTGKLNVNRDIRHFTSQMAKEARAANTFLLYRSFYPVTTELPNGDFRNTDESTNPASYRKMAGESGDLVVFVYEEIDLNDVNPETRIVRLVGYYRAASDSSTGSAPVRRFDIEIPEANQADPIESLIPPAASASNHRVVLSVAEGLANGMLFYNFNNRSVMVNAKITHGNIAKEITGTYNFTVSPRG